MEKNMVIGHVINQLFVYVFTYSTEGEYIQLSGDACAIERQGNGTHYANNGMTYTGSWKADKLNGHGK